MRLIAKDKIIETVKDLSIKSNTSLRQDVLRTLKSALRKETNPRAKHILGLIIKNARIAKSNTLAICQDTGLACVFLEIGCNVRIRGNIKSAVNRGIELGYRQGYLRNSIVREPLNRKGPKYSPCVIHIDIAEGDKLRIAVLPKGFGCENKTQVKMFLPTASLDEIKKFITDVVKNAGPDACPPYIIGVGIGGTSDYAMHLAKKALLKKIRNPCLAGRQAKQSQNSKIYKLEKELLSEINKLNIGPMGLGGKTTCLGVNILTYPTHIAGLPVAVNISCHALRSAAAVL